MPSSKSGSENDFRHSEEGLARPSPPTTGSQSSRRARLLFDVHVFEELEGEFDDPAAARAFAQDFADMWEERYRRLEKRVLQADRDAALDAVLSLKITSTMLGARRLARLAGAQEELIRRYEMSKAAALLPEIQRCGLLTMPEVRGIYLGRNDV